MVKQIWEDSVIRWAGSKRKLLSTLVKNIPESYGKYVEPFCGSACLFFALKPERALLSDINPELIEAFTSIKRHPRKVARIARSITVSKEVYSDVRATDPSGLEPLERSARFLYLNRNCFNGVYRTNRKGEFNVPMGSKTGELPSEKRFYRSHIALRNAELRVSDFVDLAEDIEENDFVYLDPPYAKPENRNRGEYGPGAFDFNDVDRMIDFLSLLDSKRAQFLFSYCEDERLEKKMPSSWYMERLDVKRHVSGFAQHRKTVREILVSNRRKIVT